MISNMRNHRTLAHDLYVLLRTSRLNEKYYGWRLHQLQRKNLCMELAIALGTSGTLMALPVFGNPIGKAVAISLASIAAILGVAKPFLGFASKIEQASKLWIGHGAIFNGTQRLRRRLVEKGEFDDGMTESLLALHDQADALCPLDDPHPDTKALSRMQDEVEVEMPGKNLWCPPESVAA